MPEKHPSLPRPTDAELEILTVLWSRGPSTVREVHETIGYRKPTQYTTVLKLLQIMAEKGLVRRDEKQRAHIYAASQPCEWTQRQLAGDLLQRAFSGSAKSLMLGALSARKVSKEELAELRKFLDEYEKDAMNNLEAWTHSPFVKALGWSLIHFLWEGMLIALLLAALLLLCRHGSARLRYSLACLALIAMAAAFGLTIALMVPSHRAISHGQIVSLTPWGPLPEKQSSPAASWPISLAGMLPWLAPFWMAGVVAFYLRSLGSWVVAQRLRRAGVCAASAAWQARPNSLRGRLDIFKPVVLLESCLVDVPVVMGFLRPVILMPMGILAGLSTDQLESILIHELAHIRRWDYAINLLQNLVEGLLFYHPAVWWVSGQIRAERENCCDDVVVNLNGDRRGYAAALATLEKNRWPARELALAANGGSLMKRIHRLLQEPDGHRASAAPVFAFGLLVVSLGVAVAGWQTTPRPTPKALSVVPDRPRLPVARPTSDASRAQTRPVTLVAQASPIPDQDSAAQVNRQMLERQKDRSEEKLHQELDSPYRKWLNEDVAYIITNEERAAYKKLPTDEEHEKFIEQFWLRRDPTPGTVENEFREEHYRRIAYTNEHFGAQIPGWKTDRGRVYISYGPPDEIESHPSGGTYQRPPEEGGGATYTVPFEQWRYRYIQDIGNNITIEFVDPMRTGEYRMTTDPLEKDASGAAPTKAGATVQMMGTPAADGGKTVLITIPVSAYGSQSVKVMATITTLTRRPVSNFEHTIQGPAVAETRFIALQPGSYRLNVWVRDGVAGTLATDEITFEVK